MGAAKGREFDAAERVQRSERQRAYMADPAARAKIRAAMTGRKANPETCAKISARKKELAALRTCFHCGSTKVALAPVEGLDGKVECVDEAACAQRILERAP